MSKLDKLAAAIAGVRVAQSSDHANLSVIFGNLDLEDHTKRLRRRADTALINASSAVGARSTQSEGTLYDPDTVSEFGVPLSTAKRDGMKEWTRDLDMDAKVSNSSTMEKDLGVRIVKDIFDRAERSWAKADYVEAEELFRAGMDRAKTLS